MKVYVTNLSSDKERLFEGTPDVVRRDILFYYPFVRSKDPEDGSELVHLLQRLNGTQMFQVQVQPDQISDDDLIESEMSDNE